MSRPWDMDFKIEFFTHYTGLKDVFRISIYFYMILSYIAINLPIFLMCNIKKIHIYLCLGIERFSTNRRHDSPKNK